MHHHYRYLVKLVLLIVSGTLLTSCSSQKPDPDFDALVERLSFPKEHPKVLFDEAHNNIHTTGGTYKPFADLISNDGYSVIPNRNIFSAKVLGGFDILVISNAKGKEHKYDPAFTKEECDAVEEWVRNGGNMLLIADHYPIGSATRVLSERFGVGMRDGFTNDSLHSESRTSSIVNGNSQLVFSRENGLLAEHPITYGRDSSERINRIVAFTGQSLTGPEGSDAFLRLAESAYDISPDSIWEAKEWIFFSNTYTRFSEPISAAGRAQGIALTFGKGRVVVLGEAAMLTAQVVEKERFGMQVGGNDNRRLALNIMHWLSRLL